MLSISDESYMIISLHTGTHKIINFPVETKGKLMVSGLPILKHIRVILCTYAVWSTALLFSCVNLALADLIVS